ncbi:MAG TPA: RHS repeat-associated core domain-containing protein [Candidatus Acidoferrales bacterium]|nr:RHS repeat-associated core domain-containing protein [Candidatus Acidoferrales bacterium]
MWLASIQAGSLFNYVYTLSLSYAGNGSVTAADDSVNGGFSFTYDNLNRLATMSSPRNPSGCYGLSWTYDSVGNRTAQSVTSGSCPTFSASVNSSNQLTGGSYAYDAAGNMTNDGLNGYSYDAAGHILSVNGGASATYVYDAFGRRIEDTGAGLVYLYDQAGRRISSVTTSGADDAHEVYAGSRLLAVHGYAGSFGKVTWVYHSDQLGTDRLITYSGSVAETCTSLPYGDGQSCTTQGFGNPPARFAGYFPEAASGLDYASARSYSPLLGRFISPDPVGGGVSNPQSLDKYTYVHGSPACQTDVSGLFCQQVAPTAGGNDLDYVFNSGVEGGGNGDSGSFYYYFDPDAAVLAAVPGPNGGGCGSGAAAPARTFVPCLPKVASFVNAHLAAAQTLAAKLGDGATAQEVLAVSAQETEYGTTGFVPYGNYFGLHGTGFAGQTGTHTTPNGIVTPEFPLSNGFLLSGEGFVSVEAPFLRGVDASNPLTFFQTIHAHGYGTGDPEYVSDMIALKPGRRGVYWLVGACTSQKH